MTHIQYIPPFLNLTESDEDVLANVNYRNESIHTLFCAEMNKNSKRELDLGENTNVGPYRHFLFSESIDIEAMSLDLESHMQDYITGHKFFAKHFRETLRIPKDKFGKEDA